MRTKANGTLRVYWPVHLIGTDESGHRGHAGIPGHRGGSLPSREAVESRLSKYAKHGETHVTVENHPLAIRAAVQTAQVLEEMHADGLEMPDRIHIGREPVPTIRAQVAGISVTDAGSGQTIRNIHLKVTIPDTLPADADLDKATEQVFGGTWSSKDFHGPVGDARPTPVQEAQISKIGDPEYPRYDRYAARTLKDIVIHEMGHVQAGHRDEPIPVAAMLSSNLFGSTAAIRRAMVRVSMYAASNPNEFLAESFLRLRRGETLAEDSMKLYRALSGPEVKGVKKLTYRQQLLFLLEGNENSGNYDHEGRPGQVGGSKPKGVSQETLDKDAKKAVETIRALAEHLKKPPKRWKVLPPEGTEHTDAYDPEYDATQKAAHVLTQERLAALLKQRGLLPNGHWESLPDMMDDMERQLWQGWKNSSSSSLGQALQLAVAEELGVLPTARLVGDEIVPMSEDTKHIARNAVAESFVTEEEKRLLQVKHGWSRYPFEAMQATPEGRPALQRKWEESNKAAWSAANTEAQELGMARAKAYVRAQWEVAQFVLAKAGVKEMDVYRGIILPNDQIVQAGVNPEESRKDWRAIVPLPKLRLVQNAAASTTTKQDVANEWDGVDVKLDPHVNSRVVLRFHVPASSVLSIPVFGQNVYAENEVVLMGVRGLQWDAYVHRAPSVESKPVMHRMVWPEAFSLADAQDDDDDPVYVDLWTPSHWLDRDETPIEPEVEEDDNGETETEPRRDLVGNERSGHWGHAGVKGQGPGGSAPGKGTAEPHAARLKSHLTEAHDYDDTRFILPDGTRLTGEGDHADITASAGVNLHDAMQAGVIRFTMFSDGTPGGEVGGAITEAQAEHLYDAAHGDALQVDLLDDQNDVRVTKTFDTYRHTVDTVRHWINGHYDGTRAFPERLVAASIRFRKAMQLGSASSGNYGHAGRPGLVGGSAPGDSVSAVEGEKTEGEKAYEAKAAYTHNKATHAEVHGRISALVPSVDISERQVTITAASHVAEVLEEMHALGYKMPDRVIIKLSRRTLMRGLIRTKGAGEFRGQKWMEIEIPMSLADDANLDHSAGLTFGGQRQAVDIVTKVIDGIGTVRKVSVLSEKAYDRFAVRNMREVIVHEMGHAQVAHMGRALVKDAKGVVKNKKQLLEAMRSVSLYASTSRDEFIAEAFVRLQRGETLTKDAQKLYDKWGGPAIKRAKALSYREKLRLFSLGGGDDDVTVA